MVPGPKNLTLTGYTYAYDAADQVTSYQDAASSLTYNYDKTGQLLSASGTLNGSSYSASWSYDANGNRNMSGYQIGTGNELLSDGTYTYTYDQNGNTLTKTNTATGDQWQYRWDYHNQLVEAVEKTKDGVVENDEKFTYDIEGRLIGVVINGVQQRWTVFDGANVYLDFNGAGTAVAKRYLTSPGAYGTLYARVSADGTVNWYITDRLGSVRQIVDASGNVLDAIVYDPWGNIVSESNPTNGDRFKFAGGQYDALQQMYLFTARWENPQDGRWESPDPLGLGPDSNPYRYVNNSPLNYVDNMGTAKFKVCNADYTDSTKAAEKLHFIETYIKTLERSLNKLPQDERKQAIEEFKKFYNDIVKKTEAGVILDNCFTWCNIVDKKSVGFKVLRKYVKVKLVIWQYPPFPPFGFPYHRIAHGALKIILPDGTYFYVDNGWWGGVDYVNIGGPGFGGASSKTIETHIFIERDIPFYCSLKD